MMGIIHECKKTHVRFVIHKKNADGEASLTASILPNLWSGASQLKETNDHAQDCGSQHPSK